MNNITKEDFLAYETIRRQGKYNMLDPLARKVAGIDKNIWIGIIKNWNNLNKKFGPDSNDV